MFGEMKDEDTGLCIHLVDEMLGMVKGVVDDLADRRAEARSAEEFEELLEELIGFGELIDYKSGFGEEAVSEEVARRLYDENECPDALGDFSKWLPCAECLRGDADDLWPDDGVSCWIEVGRCPDALGYAHLLGVRV